MKNKILKTLLAVTVCASTLLGACGAKDKNPQSDVAPKVDAIFSNFLALDNSQENGYINGVGQINDSYGDVAQIEGNYALFLKEGKSVLNEVEKVWTLYDMVAQNRVWSKTVKYQDGDYDSLDKYGNSKHAPFEVEVEITNDFRIPYITVVTKTYQAYTDEQMEEFIDNNVNANSSYIVKRNTEWFSVNGAKIGSSNFATDSKTLVREMDNNSEKVQMSFGKTIALFDKETYALLESWDGDTEIKSNLFTTENDRYIYKTDSADSPIIEILDKETSEQVAKFQLSMTMNDVDYNLAILNSGDILIQKIVKASTANYDFTFSNGMYENLPVKVVTQRFDVETSKIEDVDLDYVFDRFYTKEEFRNEIKGSGLSLTKNVHNIALARKFANGSLDKSASVYLFFDSALNIQYEWKALIPEQVDLTTMKALSNGNIIVSIESKVEDAYGNLITRAIVDKDGKLVKYLTAKETIVGDYALMVKGDEVLIYDLNGNLEYTANVSYNYGSHLPGLNILVDQAAMLGEKIVIPFYYEYGRETGYVTIYKEYIPDDYGQSKEYTFMQYINQGDEIVYVDNKIIVTSYPSSHGTMYEVYSSSNSSLLKCNDRPTIIEADNGYTIYLQRNGETYVYNLSNYSNY